MAAPSPTESSSANKPVPDLTRNAFWVFISVMGISMPKPENERKAMITIILGAILFLLFLGAGLFILFHSW